MRITAPTPSVSPESVSALLSRGSVLTSLDSSNSHGAVEASRLISSLALSPALLKSAATLYAARLPALEAHFADDTNSRTRALVSRTAGLAGMEFLLRVTRSKRYNLTSRYMLLGRCVEATHPDFGSSLLAKMFAIARLAIGTLIHAPRSVLFLVSGRE